MTWLGVPCIVGSIDIWLSDLTSSAIRGPFPLIAKFAQATPSNIPYTLPILLALNFLADEKAETHFQCHSPANAGEILIP
jgi:hypothetical protein